MISRLSVIGLMIICLLPCAVFSEDITLELMMPGVTFLPGSSVYLDLLVTNAGAALPNAQVYVALSIGTGEFWFYPDWVHYPPNVDWKDVSINGQSAQTMAIIPEFLWPNGAGAFTGAKFYAAILNDGNLISNLAEYTFNWTDNSSSVPVGNMIAVSSGGFTQGSPSWEECASETERQFNHYLTRNLSVMETEVSREMWANLKTVQPSLPDDPSAPEISPTLKHPVQLVSWYNAILFANLLSLQNGYTRCYYLDEAYTTPIDATNHTLGAVYCNFDANGYRLPTEGEWEYFARAGTTTTFSCDETGYSSANCESCSAGELPILEQYAVFCVNAWGTTAEVGTKLPNPWGLKDVHGNVWEWCWDWYAPNYPETDQVDYMGPGSGGEHVRHGGGWDEYPRYVRPAYRASRDPNRPRNDLGFRLLRTVY